MASHLSSIGFATATTQEFAGLARQIAGQSQAIPVKGGRYLRWAPGGGEELWLQVDRRREVVGMAPHFAGQASLRVGLTARVRRATDTPLDGAFHGWANPPGESPDTGDYPFVFDTPDAATYGDLTLPGIATAQIAAFAHEITTYESADAYEAQAGEMAFASQSFVPSGLFAPDGTMTTPAEAHAIFTGHVLETQERRNALTGATFHWLLVDTLGGRFDVVVDPALLSSPPAPGGVVSGAFWLSGRLQSYPRRRPWWRRMAGAG